MRANPLRRLAARIAGHAIVLACKGVTAVRADWRGVPPEPRQRVYYANHTSNADMPMVWSVLPPSLRDQTRPVAAADYWLQTSARSFFGAEVFRAVLIDRRPEARTDNPMGTILDALDQGDSLILFPEGRRNMGEAPLLPFRAGLYNIGVQRPRVELVPTWIANLNAIMPKGEVIPLPLIATVTERFDTRSEPGGGTRLCMAFRRDSGGATMPH